MSVVESTKFHQTEGPSNATMHLSEDGREESREPIASGLNAYDEIDGLDELEAAGHQEEDTNEALEDTQRATVVEPESDDTVEKRASDVSARLAQGELKSADANEMVENGGPGEIERRLFVGSKLSEELKRMREMRAKRLSTRKHKHRRRNRNRKRRRQISNKNLVKMSQTRQGSGSSTQGYDVQATSSVTETSVVPLSQTSQLTNSLRQHLSNPLNLTSAVQRLIMSKLSNNLGAQPPSVGSSSMVASSMAADMGFLQPAEGFRGDAQVKKYPAQHADLLADSYGHPQASAVLAVASASGSADSANFASRLPTLSSTHNRQVVPIEIIGLDPAVTNSIIYGANTNGALNLLDSEQSAATSGNELAQQALNHQQQTGRGLRNTNSDSQQVSSMNTNSPSILHIHHFHPLAGVGKTVIDAGSSGSGGGGGGNSGEGESDSETAEQQPQVPEGSQQQVSSPDETRVADQSNEIRPDPDQGYQNQQLFVNEKGELVYLAVQDKSSGNNELAAGDTGGQQQPALAGEPQGQENTDGAGGNGESHQPTVADSSDGEQSSDRRPKEQYATRDRQQIIIIPHPAAESIKPIPMHAGINQSAHYMGDNRQASPSSAQRILNYSQAANRSQPLNESEKMIMVAYRPSNSMHSPESASNSIRGAFNDGQESAMSSATAKQSLVAHGQNRFLSTSSGAHNLSANHSLALVDRLLKQISNSSSQEDTSLVAGPQGRPMVPLLADLQPHRQLQMVGQRILTSKGNQDAASVRLQVRPLQVEDGHSLQTAAAAAAAAAVDGLQSAPGGWPHTPISSNLSLPSVDSLGDAIDTSALFTKHFVGRPVTGLLAAQRNASQAENLLTNLELMSLFQELKRPSNGSSYPAQMGQSFHPARATKSAGFELTQASNQFPARYAKNHTLLATGAITNNHLRGAQKFGSHKEPISGPPTGTAPAGTGSDTHRPGPVIEGNRADMNDSSGISSIASAFIFVISLVTLALIAASLIYRYRRRSMGRCSNLAGRSRLNLTQRTKHFVRSNFVNPNEISSIKSINLSAGCSTFKTSSGANSSLGSGKGCRDEDNKSVPRASPIDRYTTTKSYGGANSKCLSTFKSNPAGASKERHPNELAIRQHMEEPSADIKTLNTRLQKPSYLKSLISPSSATVANENKKKRFNGAVGDVAADSHYLNVKQRHTGAAGDHRKSTSKQAAEFNQHHLSYGSSLDKRQDHELIGQQNSSMNSSPTRPDHWVQPKVHTCSPGQHRIQQATSAKLNKSAACKLSNLPLSRHIVAPNNNCMAKITPDINQGHRL